MPPRRLGVAAAARALRPVSTRRSRSCWPASGVESARVRLDLPQRFDYGNTVPLAVTVDSPMTEADHVRRVSVFAEGNPFPEVASFHFTPANGRASASTRIRLNEGSRRWSRSRS